MVSDESTTIKSAELIYWKETLDYEKEDLKAIWILNAPKIEIHLWIGYSLFWMGVFNATKIASVSKLKPGEMVN